MDNVAWRVDASCRVGGQASGALALDERRDAALA
jgi:hypothetical protein